MLLETPLSDPARKPTMAPHIEAHTVPSKRFGGQERCGPPSLRKAKNGAVRYVGSKDEEFLAHMLNDVRQQVAHVVDGEGFDQLQQVWLHGAMEAKQLQEQSEQNNDLISKSLATLKAAHSSLEAEQCNMRQALSSMSDYLNHLSHASYIGKDSRVSSECGSADSCSTPSTCATPSYDWNLGGSGQQAPSLGVSGQQLAHPVGCSTPRNGDQTAPVQMLSLASALGIESPRKNLQPNPAASGQSSQNVHPEQDEADAFIFSLTLRVADAGDLGLALSPSGTVLRIDFVIPGSAAEAWNRQCSCSGSPDRVLQPGDQIVSVNDVAGDAQAMINECRNRLVKLFIVRASAARLAERQSMDPTGNAAVQSVVLASPSRKGASSWPSPASAPPASPPPGSPPCSPATPPPPTAPPNFGQAAPKAPPPTLPPTLPLPARSLNFGEPAPGARMLEAPPGLPMPPSMTLSGFPPSIAQKAGEPAWLSNNV